MLRSLGDKQAWEPQSYDDLHLAQVQVAKEQNQNRMNNSLLILANLSFSYRENKRYGKGTWDQHNCLMPAYRVQEFVESVRTGFGFHRAGPVRLLVWVDPPWSTALLPRTVADRTQQHLLLEMFARIEEVVGCQDEDGYSRKRDDLIDLESGINVAKRMTNAGMSNHKIRQDEMQQRVQEIYGGKKDPKILKRLTARRGWNRELDDLLAQFRIGTFTQTEGGPYNVELTLYGGHPPEVPPYTAQWKRMNSLRRDLGSVQKAAQKVQALLEREDQLNAIDHELQNPHLTVDEKRHKSTARGQVATTLSTDLNKLSGYERQRYNHLHDDHKAFRLDPPLLSWDQREAEPLISHKDEFFSRHDEGVMSLLDIRPRPPSNYPLTSPQLTHLQNLRRALFTVPSGPLKSLDFIAPGASAAMLKAVPAFTDPRLGGERDITQLRTRTLTPEMMHGLALAWDKWPFKPSGHEMLGNASNLA